MARKQVIVTIDSDGRDKGKQFLVVEMPASQAEKWALRAMSAALRSGINVSDDMMMRGMQGIAIVGVRALVGISFADAEPLMDEMFGCIQRVETKVTRPLVEDDIEEVTTRLRLRSEVLECHIGFSVAAFLSDRWKAANQATTDADTPSAETSAQPSQPSSAPDSLRSMS